jgi:hypothetical protein
MVSHSPEEAEMKQTYRYGNASALNVWTVGYVSTPPQCALAEN